MAPGANLAITGILSGQADEVTTAWSGWADMKVSGQTRDWVLLTGRKYQPEQSETED
jgi:ribosomal protein L11 methylase PrmA